MKIYGLFLIIFFAFGVQAQTFQREFSLSANGAVEIVNLYGRVEISADEPEKSDENGEAKESGKALLTAENARETDLKIVSENNHLSITANPTDTKSRVDLTLKIPQRMRVRVETDEGEVRLSGDIASADVKSQTGTISTNVPLENLKYDFVWTESRPRFLSDVELKKVREKAGGKFVVSGKIVGEEKGKGEREDSESEQTSDEIQAETTDGKQTEDGKKSKTKKHYRHCRDGCAERTHDQPLRAFQSGSPA